jgi:hypothetical protein
VKMFKIAGGTAIANAGVKRLKSSVDSIQSP